MDIAPPVETERAHTLLNEFYNELDFAILSKQNPVTGLLPASTAITTHGNYTDAWVRDNVYSILAVWGLAAAYRRFDDASGRAYELEKRTIHLMRGLLRSMMQQADKVEAFKHSRQPQDALHAKYDTRTGDVVVGDSEWGHLQIDATSVFLLMLAQMISGGLEIVWSLDEVTFVQNLVYYIERAYRTPDYGIWERGAKSNAGEVELNASSVGMAKAALEALSGFNLFGSKGGQASVIHVAPDNIAQADITLRSMLPRESQSKEIDAALLSVIGFPAFAIDDPVLATKVSQELSTKLEGRYGLRRFLRDGHQTVLEDESRLHYQREELKQFENVESEWPLFFAYRFLSAALVQDEPLTELYFSKLQSLLLERDGFCLLPELYMVPAAAVEAEKERPRSQDRIPNENVPLVWAQSLFFLGRLVRDGLILPSDIDPLGRRRTAPARRPVVQVVLVAEDAALQAELGEHGVQTETVPDIDPVQLYEPADIVSAHEQVGRNDRLGLTGRAARALKSLMTSRVYKIANTTAVCLAPFFTQKDFYLAFDIEFLVQRFCSEVRYLHENWTAVGRPTVTLYLSRDLLGEERSEFYELMKEVAFGDVKGVPVRSGRLSELMPTASFERIDDVGASPVRTPNTTIAPQRPSVLTHSDENQPLEGSVELAIDRVTQALPLLSRLENTDNLYEQVEVLSALARISELDDSFGLHQKQVTLRELLEEAYERAGKLRLWAVVRHAAGLLGKVDGDVTLAVGAILVRHKYVQIGRAYSPDSLVVEPVTERALMELIRNHCRNDVRDRVLTQELLLYLGTLIKAHPELFEDMITIRVGHLANLLAAQLASEHGLEMDAAYDRLMEESPSKVQSSLRSVLSRYQVIATLPQQFDHLGITDGGEEMGWKQDLGFEKIPEPSDGWHGWRRHAGVVDRISDDFYATTWKLFRHTPGLIIGDKLERRNRMDSSVVLSDMTSGEQAFALWLEHLLNKVSPAEYRQLNVEALHVLGSFFEQHRELKLGDAIALDALIGHAVHLGYIEAHPEHADDYQSHKSAAWQHFYKRAPVSTSGLLVAALEHLTQERDELGQRAS